MGEKSAWKNVIMCLLIWNNHIYFIVLKLSGKSVIIIIGGICNNDCSTGGMR